MIITNKFLKNIVDIYVNGYENSAILIESFRILYEFDLLFEEGKKILQLDMIDKAKEILNNRE